MSYKKSSYIVGMMLFAGLIESAGAQEAFSGNLSLVSTYVWRGIKVNNGPALQGSAAGSFGIFALGFWGSSVDLGNDQEIETDLFAEIGLPTGDFSTSLGATVYMFDFRSFNASADAEVELYALVEYGALGVAGYYIPKQNSTKGDLNRSVYYLALTGGMQLQNADLAAQLSYGTYSSRWLPEGPKKDAAALLLLSAGTSVAEAISVSCNYSIDLGSGFENIFYFGGSYDF